jgi:hypothetical protein
MQTQLHDSIYDAFLTLFRPLAKVLIRNGIAYGTFAEWAKKVYVDVAFAEFGEPGRKQTISRVSALTGLFRRETKRLREMPRNPGEGPAERYNRAVRVIGGWVNDPAFQDANGDPALLQVEGATGSFAALVKEYSGDIPTQAMLSVLKAAGSVAETENGELELVKHAYIPGNDPNDKIHILGTDVAELVSTIDHNLTASPEDLFFQRKVSNPAVRADAVPMFRALSGEKAQALLEELDAWLSQHEVGPDTKDTGTEARYVCLGIYYYEHPSSKEERP